MEDNTIKDLVSDMLSNIVLGDKPEEEQVTSTGLMSSLPGIRTPTQVQQQDEQEAAPKARDKVKEFILRLSDEAEDTNRLRYSEKDAPEITDVMVDSETLLNRYDTPMYVYARNLRDYNPERSTIKVRNRGDHSERFLDQMYELARQSSEEAALARMETGITESLPRSAPRMGFDVQGLIDAVNRENALRAGTKPLPSIPEVKTEELDDEEVAILSDTDSDTDDADGGAAPSDGKGLMSPKLDGKDGDLAESYDVMEMDAFLDEFIPEILELEGTGGDVVLGDLEPTYSFGITEAKANEYNMHPSQYNTMEEFARAFAARYRKEKEDMYPDIFTEDLDKEIEKGLQSYLWNRGSFYAGQLRELRAGNFDGFINELKDVVNAADTATPNNQSRPMSGLSKRRAAEANLVGRGIQGYVPIATVETAGTEQRPIFIWKDAQGNELNRFEPTKALHSMSSLGEVRVPI